MSTSPANSDPTEGQVYSAYQSLLDLLNGACESTSDPQAVMALNDAAQALSDMLSNENEIVLEANTAAFTALTPEMKTANDALKKLKDQTDAIAAKIGTAGKVFAAIDGVLQLTGKFL
ncbi:MAG: hypothetical protein ABR987_03085 [Terracidiphilus sp.]|jgi:hypothetical protein